MKRIFLVFGVLILTITSISHAQIQTRTKREVAKQEASERRGATQETSAPLLPPPVGPRKTIAVAAFENKGGFRAEWELGTGLADMLATSLVKSNRFTVVERQSVADILQEQDFGGTGRTREAGSAKVGKMLNAQVLVRGALTELEQTSSGGGQGFSYAGVSLGMSQAKAHIGLNIRIYDTTTGEVLDSVRIDGNANRSAIAAGGNILGAGFNTNQFQKTPLGSACQDAIDKAVAFIVQKMDRIPWQGSIVTIKEDQVYINAGQNSNINIGDEFIVYKKGEELIDPVSGASLGSTIKNIGEIKVQSVDEKFAIASATAGNVRSFSTGDIIKMK